MTTEENYPYTSGEAGEDGECDYDRVNNSTKSVHLDGYVKLPVND